MRSTADQDKQGRTLIQVVAQGWFGPATERSVRHRAKADAWELGFARVRKLDTKKTDAFTVVTYVAYRPRSLDNRPPEDAE